MGKARHKKKRSRQTRARTSPAPGRPSVRRRKPLLVGGLAAVALVGITVFAVLTDRSSGEGEPTVDVSLPELSTMAQRGARAFETNCSRCHGTKAGGTQTGPPLVHRIYEPSHHGDNAIRRAARLGVQPHHWRFGAMPKIDVSDRELNSVIAYVRELQRANGIR